MQINANRIWLRTLRLVGLWPLSLERKCRLTFGGAVVLTLVIALLLPYIWMNQLMKKGYLDTDRGKADALLFRDHFKVKDTGESDLVALDPSGAMMDVNNPPIRWIRLTKRYQEQLTPVLAKVVDDPNNLARLVSDVNDVITDEERSDTRMLTVEGDVHKSIYVRVFRASDQCITCHFPEGSAAAFTRNELIGAVVIKRTIPDIARTSFLNRLWIIFAGIIAGTGAIVSFYWITQRVILRPIRQLRAMVNNVAEGNLDVRSAIRTADEYERLARAFNHMLDNLQATQHRLRQANTELDTKIAEVSERNIELLKANKVKDEFISNVSHEFRTPLNAILGFAQVLKEKPGSLKKETGQRYADNIITSGRRLLSMINDLLDLAKTQAGKMELHVSETTVAGLVHRLVTQFTLLAGEKKLKVKTDIDKDIPPLMTDPGKVQQILHNFLSNAVKFTAPKGKIDITANMVGEKTVRISITDTGCGIDEGDLQRIFEKFHQVDTSMTRETPGSGLGLAISRELAAMLAGSVGVESELGVGSTFWLEIPVSLVGDQDPEQ